MKDFLKKNSNIIIALLFLFFMFILIDTIVQKSILGNTPWNTYELQARAWLNGTTYLPRNYEYLELAIYNGNYYVSFPPFPSVILIPFVLICKGTIPANLLIFTFFSLEYFYIYKIVSKYKKNEIIALLLATGFTVGTNLLSLSIDSGVWFFAQVLNNLLCILAVNAFLKGKKTWVYFFLALAVGCRPFSAIYMIMFFIYYLINEREDSLSKRLLNNIKPLIPAMIIAVIYMTYNYVRFDNILEFGHNYLPEFTRTKDGQFSLNYFLSNFKQLFFNKIKVDNKLNLSFNMPFSFFVANPVIIMYIYRSIKNLIKTKKVDILRLLIFITTLINIIFICLHRTLGAWQFGARYTCDILPFVFLGFIYKKHGDGVIKLDKFEIVCIIFGVVLNIFGAIIMHID